MKVKELYVCSRCSRRGHRGSKCISCRVELEKMCMVCNNAENNCYFVNCNRVAKLKKLIKKTKAIKPAKARKTKTRKTKKGKAMRRRK